MSKSEQDISQEVSQEVSATTSTPIAMSVKMPFANPTPVCLTGFIISLGPLACDLMGWRGAGGSGSSSIGVYFFTGGLLMILGAIGEFILGNTYPCVVFGGFGAWWLSFGSTLVSSFDAYANYSPDDPSAGLSTTGFNSGFAFYLTFMGLFSLVCLICALKLNLVLIIIHTTIALCFFLLAAAFWYGAEGNASMSGSLTIAGGALGFASTAAAGYLFLALMLASVDFPVSLPVGDTSFLFKKKEKTVSEGDESV